MNQTDPNLAGDWPAVPDEGGSGCGTVSLIVAIVVCLFVIMAAMAVFGSRGCA